MEEEVKMLFDLAYKPVMYANQRLNGGDFISVAIPIVDALRKQISDDSKLKKAAEIMVSEFNEMLNPKMSVQQIDDVIQLIYNPGPVTRAIAKHIADEFIQTHK